MTPTTPRFSTATKWLASGAVALGLGIGAVGIASAATEDTTPSTSTNSSVDAPAADGQLPPADSARPDPASLPNGPGETVLTGDEAAKVTAAAEAAQPGATVIRVETDNEGHAYEAHLQLADGSYLTLYFDESFNADGSDQGFGPMHGGGHHGHGGPLGDRDGDGPADGQAPVDGTSGTTGGVIDGGPADSTATTTAG